MTTKYAFLITLFLFTTINLFAQKKSNSFIGISGGLSIPTGNFSSSDVGTFGNWNNKNWFAKTGFNIGLEGTYYILPKIGIGGIINFSDHGRLTNNDAQKLGNSYTDAFAVDFTTVSVSKRYQTLNFLVGPYYSLNFTKFILDFRLLGGLSKSISTPEVSVQLEDDPSNVFTQKSSTASAFGWQVGLGARYLINKSLSLLLRGDYFNSKGIKITNENRNNNAGRLVSKQPLSWINTSLGLAYVLGK